MSDILIFPVHPRPAISRSPVTEAEVNAPSRSETMIRALDAILDRMVACRGLSWAEAIIDRALARQVEKIAETF